MTEKAHWRGLMSVSSTLLRCSAIASLLLSSACTCVGISGPPNAHLSLTAFSCTGGVFAQAARGPFKGSGLTMWINSDADQAFTRQRAAFIQIDSRDLGVIAYSNERGY